MIYLRHINLFPFGSYPKCLSLLLFNQHIPLKWLRMMRLNIPVWWYDPLWRQRADKIRTSCTTPGKIIRGNSKTIWCDARGRVFRKPHRVWIYNIKTLMVFGIVTHHTEIQMINISSDFLPHLTAHIYQSKREFHYA